MYMFCVVSCLLQPYLQLAGHLVVRAKGATVLWSVLQTLTFFLQLLPAGSSLVASPRSATFLATAAAISSETARMSEMLG